MKQGDVWLVNFAPKVGQEIDKIRPAIIVNQEALGALNLKIIVPVTDAAQKTKLWHAQLQPSSANGLIKTSVADCFQVKSISTERFVRKIGVLKAEEFDLIKERLMLVLDLI